MPNPPMRRPRVEQRRTDIARTSEASADLTWVVGRVLVKGLGEAFHHVKFPVTFSMKPFPVLGGGELYGNDSPEFEAFPTIDAMVTGWDTSTQRRYTGATLSIVSNGRPDQSVWMTFAFVGVALTNASTDEEA